MTSLPSNAPISSTDPPFVQHKVILTQAEHIELKHQANYWKSQHHRLQEKCAELQHELDLAEAAIRDLKQRLYGKSSEKKTSKRDTANSSSSSGGSSSRPRGQQPGSSGHGRTPRPHLPVVIEGRDVDGSDRCCSCCGQPYQALSQTEDSEIIEIEVKAYTRRIKRNKYVQDCQCVDVPGVITAPVAPRLIPKSSLGLSVWTELLLNKFLFSRATHNLCVDYAHRGLPLAPIWSR